MDFDTLWENRPRWPFKSTSKERAQYYFNKGVESVVVNSERLNKAVQHGRADCLGFGVCIHNDIETCADCDDYEPHAS